MPSPYDSDAFATRVNFAASYISAGRRTTRHFDTCFEMWDGDAVAVALYRRSRKNPKLRANLWRYIGRSTVLPTAFKERRRPTRALSVWAAELRRKAEERSAAENAKYQADCKARHDAAKAAGYTVREVPKDGFSMWQYVRPDGSASEEIHHEGSAWHFAHEDMATA